MAEERASYKVMIGDVEVDAQPVRDAERWGIHPIAATSDSQFAAYAQLCPVCDGVGHWPPRQDLQRTCHGCDGKGWVTVR